MAVGHPTSKRQKVVKPSGALLYGAKVIGPLHPYRAKRRMPQRSPSQMDLMLTRGQLKPAQLGFLRQFDPLHRHRLRWASHRVLLIRLALREQTSGGLGSNQLGNGGFEE